jgi:Tfp pilus assembly protein PilE
MRTHKWGFTIMEIIVVVIILSLLGAIAWTRYDIMRRKIECQEGANILRQVYSAQKRYKLYNGAYATATSALDLEVRSPKYFNSVYLNATAETISCSGSGLLWLAGIDPQSGGYSLRVTEQGRIVCTPCSNVTCNKMGYFADW